MNNGAGLQKQVDYLTREVQAALKGKVPLALICAYVYQHPEWGASDQHFILGVINRAAGVS